MNVPPRTYACAALTHLFAPEGSAARHQNAAFRGVGAVLPQGSALCRDRTETVRDWHGNCLLYCSGEGSRQVLLVTVPSPEGPATKEDVPDIQCNPAADVGCRDLLSVGLSFFETRTSIIEPCGSMREEVRHTRLGEEVARRAGHPSKNECSF